MPTCIDVFMHQLIACPTATLWEWVEIAGGTMKEVTGLIQGTLRFKVPCIRPVKDNRFYSCWVSKSKTYYPLLHGWGLTGRMKAKTAERVGQIHYAAVLLHMRIFVVTLEL